MWVVWVGGPVGWRHARVMVVQGRGRHLGWFSIRTVLPDYTLALEKDEEVLNGREEEGRKPG